MGRAIRHASVAVLLLAGCASGASQGWLDRALGRSPAQGSARAAYAAADRTKVFSEPSATSPVAGLLTLNEKIARYQSQGGFAYVEAEGDLSGWVRENQLLARPPAPVNAATSRPAPTADEATPTEVIPNEEAPSDETSPGSETNPPEPEHSVFDPY